MNKIRNPKTGRMVKKDGEVGKQVLGNAATIMQKIYRGKKNRNHVRQITMTMNTFLNEAVKAGFDKRYAKEFVNYLGYYPTIKQLNNSLNSKFADRFKNHFGNRNIKPGNKVEEEKKKLIAMMKSLGMNTNKMQGLMNSL